MWLLPLIGGVLLLLTQLAPFPFLLDWANRDVVMWRVPQGEERGDARGADAPPPQVYLTFDDGPNPDATPALLDVLARHGVRATFFIIDAHLTPATAPIVARAAAEGHSIALHSDTRALMQLSPDALVRTLDAAADRMERLTGTRPCPAFRPHGGGRSRGMIAGLRQSGRRLVGWGMFLWDWDWFRRRSPDRIAPRIARRAGPGSIIVLHDGHHRNPRAPRAYTPETVDRLVPLLRLKGLEFGSICDVVVDD
jgi:peptidoglycan-N-acetylglucosamine deacetylase